VLSVTSALVQLDEAQSPDLLARAQAGDGDAFCALCRPYETRLLRQALALCRDRALAEELAQDTIVEAWKWVRRYHGRCRFFTWLCAILLNRYRNIRRQRRPIPFSALKRAEDESARDILDSLIDRASQPDLSAQEAERDAVLRESIERLPNKHREVIHLRFFVDDSMEGIAAALHCSVGTVKSRLYHALEKLRAFQEIATTHAEWKESDGEP
jgi:RNA polymerase sigma-70 factor, ECF subfamily